MAATSVFDIRRRDAAEFRFVLGSFSTIKFGNKRLETFVLMKVPEPLIRGQIEVRRTVAFTNLLQRGNHFVVETLLQPGWDRSGFTATVGIADAGRLHGDPKQPFPVALP
jgi:hypothetical protein